MIISPKTKKILIDNGYEKLLKLKEYKFTYFISLYLIPKIDDVLSIEESVKIREKEKFLKQKELDENLEKRVLDIKDFMVKNSDIIKNKEIKKAFEHLIHIGENCLKYPFILSCRDSIYKLFDTMFSLVYNGDIYFFDSDTYDLKTIIKNEFIKEIKLEKNSKKLAEYEPHYIKPSKPINYARLHSGRLKEIDQAEYDRKLVEYQIDLIKAEIHNRQEDEIKKSLSNRDLKYTTTSIYYYNNMKNKEDGKTDVIKIDVLNAYQPYYYYIDRRLLNIPKVTYDDVITGFNFIGTKKVGYIDIPCNKKIKSSKLIEDGFQLNFDNNTKIILKVLKDIKINEYLKKHTEYEKYNYDWFDDTYFSDDIFDLTDTRVYNGDGITRVGKTVFPYDINIYVNSSSKTVEKEVYKEILVEDPKGYLLYVYSDSDTYKLYAKSIVYYFYQNKYLEEYSLLESYNIIDLEKKTKLRLRYD